MPQYPPPPPPPHVPSVAGGRKYWAQERTGAREGDTSYSPSDQDSLGFWIPQCGFRIPYTGSQILSAELGFQIPSYVGFRIPRVVVRIPKPRIRDCTGKNLEDSGFHEKNFPDSRIHILLHGATNRCSLQVMGSYVRFLFPPRHQSAPESLLTG